MRRLQNEDSRFSEQELSRLVDRDFVTVDLEPLRTLFAGKSVMVTGAAGSIGAELCSQLLSLEPKTLVCLDHDETAIFELEHRLGRGATMIEFRVDDVGDSAQVRRLIRESGVTTIFHAAAYKHVPLMERNPVGAVKNNVLALRRMLQVAEEEGVEDFLLISSDKAVNPASVMGCTKRIGELMFSAWPGGMRTMSVRFGNVLGSQGSVLPVLRQQLQEGGPLRVTHPEASRFFMTIREAASLLLLAFSVRSAGEVLVLKVGEPLSVVRLAERVAALFAAPETRIEFTGLRAGEKLHEELFYPTEIQVATACKNIIRAQGAAVAWDDLRRKLDELERCIADGRREELHEALARIVPEYDFAWSGKQAEVRL
jgi:FlaA1/EpsC-like NDP-sugar epimerase